MNRIPSSDVDRLGVVFDDGSLVADAGLLVAGTLMARLGLEQLLDETVRLGDRVGGSRPGRKVLSLVAVRSETAGDRSFPPAGWFLTERRRPFHCGDGEPGQTGRSRRSGDSTGRFWVLVLPPDS